jgi:hypothetical protein
MNRLQAAWMVMIAWLIAPLDLLAQEQPPAASPRVEAKKEVIVNWTLGDQAWDFKDILTGYEPIRGHLEQGGDGNEKGMLAVWKLRQIRDAEPGAVQLHTNIPGSPFRVILLDSDRTVINQDAAARITEPSGKMDDTIMLYVALPDTPLLKEVKSVRLVKRTDIGF